MKSPFPLPLAFTSQAFKKNPGGPEWANAVRDVTNLARTVGMKTVAVQVNTGWHGEATADDVKQLKANGLYVVAWGVCDQHTAQRVRHLGVQGFMPQVESFAEHTSAVETLRALAGQLPVAVVTNWHGFDPPQANQARDLGADSVFVEAYASEGSSHADLAHYVAYFGGTRGYTLDHCIPALGTYRSEAPSAYTGIGAYAGPSFSVYLLETIAAHQLDGWAKHAAAQPVNPPKPPPTGSTVPQLRAKVTELAREWESKITTPDPLSRATNIRLIAEADDKRWAKVRAAVARALAG